MASRRAAMLKTVRAFFEQQGVLEVETPQLSRAAISDPSIQGLSTHLAGCDYYLHTSPELPMKRLLAADWGDIYQICKVFRAGEAGRYHSPEFTLLEWYRVGWDDEQLRRETVALIQALAGRTLAVSEWTYAEVFATALELDALTASIEALRQVAQQRGVAPEGEMARDAWLDLLFSTVVAPGFADDQLVVITDYPASQAVLARLKPDGGTAARFEIFWGSLELANGYYELCDPLEQRRRFEADQARRKAESLPLAPLDEAFLAALEAGMPDCAGVALGLDRLLMKITGANCIDEVLSFSLT